MTLRGCSLNGLIAGSFARGRRLTDAEVASAIAVCLRRRQFVVDEQGADLRFRGGPLRWVGWKTMGPIESGSLSVEVHESAFAIHYSLKYCELLLVVAAMAIAIGVSIFLSTGRYSLAVVVATVAPSCFFVASLALSTLHFRHIVRRSCC